MASFDAKIDVKLDMFDGSNPDSQVQDMILHSFLHTYHSYVHTFMSATNTQCTHKHIDTRETARTCSVCLKQVFGAHRAARFRCTSFLVVFPPRLQLTSARSCTLHSALGVMVSALVTAELDERDKRAFGLDRHLVAFFPGASMRRTVSQESWVWSLLWMASRFLLTVTVY